MNSKGGSSPEENRVLIRQDGENMKVVVYLRAVRHSGSLSPSAFNASTHWIEDENDVPVASFSQLDPVDVNGIDPELLVQLQSVNTWLEKNQAIVVANLIETETGNKSRPAYGVARKVAVRESTTLLVATTKSILGQRFSPISQDGLNVLCLDDPEEIARAEWSRSHELVVYFRTPVEVGKAEKLLTKQRRELDRMLRSGIGAAVAEFTEIEDSTSLHPARPVLSDALAVCRERKARLVIGTTDAFGASGEFQPNFTDVPYEVAYRAEYEWPETIKLEAPPFQLALYFGQTWVRGNVPLYVANATTNDLHDVTVSSIGLTEADGESIETTTSEKKLGTIRAGTGRLLEAYDLKFDSDFVVVYTVAATETDGVRRGGQAITKGPPSQRWLRIDRWSPILA